MARQEIRTVCRMCHGGCGAIVEVTGEGPVRIRGDRANPNNRGFLCAKGLASIEHLRHPDRLRRPLRRRGPKGTGDFEPITWEQAYEEIAMHMAEVRARKGAESVVFAQGTDRNYQEWLFRFANAFGSPNMLGPAHVCFYPRMMAGILSMGAFTFCDYEATPHCLLAWGSNKVLTHGDGVIGTRLIGALKRGTELVVVDPRQTWLAARARHWLAVRPGADAALALALLHVVVTEELFDRDFVENYTSGFEQLARHVQAYAPEKVAGHTGVPADQIREAARFYATSRPAAIEAGTGIEQHHDSFHTARSLCILSAICGNLDRPGGDVIWEPTGIVGRRTFPSTESLPARQQAKRLGGAEHRILSMAGWAHPEGVWTAILEERPYPVRMMLVFGSNLLVNYADSERVHAALDRLGFLVVSELFLTPTARMADIVLPVTSWLERDQIVEHAHYLASRRAAAERLGECRSDEQILCDLAARLGLEGFWKSAEEALDYKLAPIGMGWKELTFDGYHANTLTYHKYRTAGFPIRSGRFQIYCDQLRRFGYEPLPVSQSMARQQPEQAYLLTTAHPRHYFNSEFRNVSSLRRREPDPVVELAPTAARREGIADGDWVEISVRDRRALFRAKLTEALAEDVVCVSPTWWHPELPFESSWRRSNVNILTCAGDENPEMGSSNFRGIWCNIRRWMVTTRAEGGGS